MKQLPKGLDQQGRYPEAAECCTEVGADVEPPDSWRPLQDLMVALAAVACIVIVFTLGFVAGLQ